MLDGHMDPTLCIYRPKHNQTAAPTSHVIAKYLRKEINSPTRAYKVYDKHLTPCIL